MKGSSSGERGGTAGGRSTGVLIGTAADVPMRMIGGSGSLSRSESVSPGSFGREGELSGFGRDPPGATTFGFWRGPCGVTGWTIRGSGGFGSALAVSLGFSFEPLMAITAATITPISTTPPTAPPISNFLLDESSSFRFFCAAAHRRHPGRASALS